MAVEDARAEERGAAAAEIAALTAGAEEREEALSRQLREREAELAAAMEGLAAARRGG